jgi:putative phosphoribosyl transferase
MARLADVRAPTLLIVGGHDRDVLALNRLALARLRCPTELAIVPGATHLFDEPGALDTVAARARDWFLRWSSDSGLMGLDASRRDRAEARAEEPCHDRYG